MASPGMQMVARVGHALSPVLSGANILFLSTQMVSLSLSDRKETGCRKSRLSRELGRGSAEALHNAVM